MNSERKQSRMNFKKSKLEMFEKQHGFSPECENPRRFSEKLLSRILGPIDPHYELYGRKIAAPYFANMYGIENLHFAKRMLVKQTIRPGDFADLPNKFVLKSSFGSGLNEIVADKSQLDLDAMCERFNSELLTKTNAQGNTDPLNCCIVEEFLEGADGLSLRDYKVHCFSVAGKRSKMFLQIDSDRFDGHRQSFFDTDHKPLDLQIGRVPKHDTPPSLPSQTDEIFNIAAKLSANFDYIRVDFYLSNDRIYFGEYTPFHQGGNGVVCDLEWDAKLGNLWSVTTPTYTPTHEW